MKFHKVQIFVLMLVSLKAGSLFAGDLDFALAMAKDGYTDLADQFLLRINKNEIMKDEAKYHTTMYEIKMAQFRLEKDRTKKQQLLNEAKDHFQKSNPTALESANNKYQTANLIALDLRDFSISQEEKTKIRESIIPMYAEARDDFKKIGSSLLEAFQNGMDKVYEDRKFQKSKEFKVWVDEVYTPFVISHMRYFECIVESRELMASNDPNKTLKLEDYIIEAEDFTYICDAPVPVANINVYAARMHAILALSGKNAKENNEKALLKFQEVLDISTNNANDRQLILHVQAEACKGKMEMAMKLNEYKEAVSALEYYLKEVRKGYKVTPNEFDIMLGGMLSYAYLLKTTEEKKIENSIESLKTIIERCAKASGNTDYWNRKLVDYIREKDMILGKETEDPEILIQMANGHQRDEKFENAIELYKKALSKNFSTLDALKLKPSTYYSATFCAYKAGKFDVGVDLMKEFFAEFPPTDKKNEGLKEQYEKSAKIFNIVAGKQFELKQDDASKADALKSLDYLEKFAPELALFKKVELLAQGNNYIDAIKLLNEIKETSVDYDKALFLKGLYLFKYSKNEKDDNDGIHSDLSLKLTEQCKESFEAYLKFIKDDKTDLIQNKRDLRIAWAKDAKKLLAFTLVSLEKFSESVALFEDLIETYEKDKEDKVSSNMFFVVTGLFGSYANAFDKEKDEKKRNDMLIKQKALVKKIEEMPIAVFSQYDNPEKRKEEIVNNYKLRLGLKMMSSKDDAIKKEGLGLIESGSISKNIENFNLFIARKLFENEDYVSASIKFKETLDEYAKKGYNVPLDEKDFDPILKGFVNDKDISLFKNFFYHYAVNKKDEVTRDFSRLRKHIGYVLDTTLVPENESEEDRKIRLQIQEAAPRHDWEKLVSSNKFKELDLRLKEFLTYLGIVDDLAICYLRTNEFEEAIKYLEILRKFYPGIFSEDVKLANLKFEYARFLINENKSKESALKITNEALDMFVDLKKRMGSSKEGKLYQDIDQKRLICYTWRYKLGGNQDDLTKVHTALQIMYSNQQKYWEYKKLLAVLENSNNLPDDLKPLTPEEVRKRDEAIQLQIDEVIKNDLKLKKEREEKEKEIRRTQVLITDPSFVDWELRDIDDATLELFKNYLEKIEGFEKLPTDGTKYIVIKEALNSLIRDPKLSKKIPSEHLAGKENVAGYLKEIETILSKKSEKEASEDPKFCYMNRLLLEAAFSKLPKYK